MGYQALLFCPDEKTARTVTQVLSELEFSVEACMEPFAAVKKLMGQHFDAIVVDCDNEQNAALLFKSARTSTSNQASLAVAVVEGQAGVAKAFRIGANLVLTKPINVEQAKGTLRVARGLLRKGDPAKPVAAVTTAAPAATTPTPIAAGPKPAAPKPVAPKPAPVASAAIATPRPAAPVAPKPAAPPVRPLAAVASAAPAAPVAKKEIPEVKVESPVAPAPKLPTPASAAAAPLATPHFSTSPLATPAALPTTFGGAASAPAPAREVHDVTQDAPVAAATSAAAGSSELVLDAPAEEVQAEAGSTDSFSSHSSNSTFTFGGANVAETSSGSKKIFLGIGAAVLVLGALYFAWTSYKSGPSQPTIALPAPATASQSSTSQSAPQTAKPVTAQPRPASPAPVTSAPITSALGATAQPAATSTPSASTTPSADSGTVPENDAPAPSKPEGKSAAKTSSAPMMVKGGSAPAVHAKPATADAPPPPSMMAIATTGSNAPPPNIGGSASAPKPILQTLNVSQGVSQGLLVKKVQPVYPKSALAMQVEGAVQLAATISKSGDISAVKVLKGPAQLTKAAADAVRQWKYKPYLLNGEPVEIQTEVTINFKLPH